MGEGLANWLISSIWRNKVWWIDRSANRLLIVSTNLDGLSLANFGWFANFAKLSHYVYGISACGVDEKEKGSKMVGKSASCAL